MSFAREGYALMALGASAAIAVLALAVWRRGWALWLLGYLLLLVAAGVAYFFRSPERDGLRGARAVSEQLDQRTVGGTAVIPERPV